MKKIIFITAILQALSCYGSFSDESKNIILNGKYRFSSSWSGAVWSSCRARKYGRLKLPAEHVVVGLKSSGFESGEYLSNIFVNRRKTGELNSAPVSFIINGIFGEPMSGLVKQVANQLLARGHHVIGLGNPLGQWGIKQKPTYTMANFVQESEVYLDIMDKTVEWLNHHGLSNGEVNLVGVSYGGFIASVMKSMDAKRSMSLINGMTTLLSPPLKMGAALRNMDHVLFETQKLGRLPDWVFGVVSLRFCSLPPRNYMSRVDLQWAKAIFGYYGFQRSLADNTILIDDLYGLGRVPSDQRERKRWRRSFTFGHYIENFATELGELMDSPYGDLFYWLDDIEDEQYQIFASTDDPLNEEVLWPQKNNTFLINYGGHYGFRAFKYFDKFLYSIF